MALPTAKVQLCRVLRKVHGRVAERDTLGALSGPLSRVQHFSYTHQWQRPRGYQDAWVNITHSKRS